MGPSAELSLDGSLRGVPGTVVLGNRLPGLLPGLDRSTALEATRIHSVAGLPLPPGG
jgi:magnesium chelatase family protein